MRSSASTTETGSEEGSTLLETVIALAIFSIALFALWAMSTRISTAYSTAQAASASAERAELLDRGLRSLCARVSLPFWAVLPDDVLSPDGSRVSLPFLDGEANSTLVITHDEKEVLIDASGTKLRFEGISELKLSAIKSASGALAGLKADFISGGKEYSCRAPFSSISLVKREAP
jgi:type II secretory pathway pseudopilin PulG